MSGIASAFWCISHLSLLFCTWRLSLGKSVTWEPLLLCSFPASSVYSLSISTIIICLLRFFFYVHQNLNANYNTRVKLEDIQTILKYLDCTRGLIILEQHTGFFFQKIAMQSSAIMKKQFLSNCLKVSGLLLCSAEISINLSLN